MIEHKYLYYAQKINKIFDEVIADINNDLNDLLKSELSTIAINLWSPYLAWGRSTFLKYPNDKSQDEEEKKKIIHRRYLSLFGRNFSINHLFLEVKDLKKIEIYGDEVELLGPEIIDEENIQLKLPKLNGIQDQFLKNLMPNDKVDEWIINLTHDKYEILFKSLFKQQLKDCRKHAKHIYPPSFAGYVYNFISKNAISSRIGLNEIDDKWLSRIQMTLIASKIWGPFWHSELINIKNSIAHLLELKASYTITSYKNIHDIIEIKNEIDKIPEKISNIIDKKLEVLNQVQFSETFGYILDELSEDFSMKLGSNLIGEDHEGKPLTFRGILTQGLDSIGEISSFAEVIHEINQDDFENGLIDSDTWALWKAYYKSNDLYLSKEDICLHFEMKLTDEVSKKVIIVPRHVLKIQGSVENFLERIDDPKCELLQQAFETNQFIALHYKKVEDKIERRIQLKGQILKEIWKSSVKHHDWGCVRDILEEVYRYIKSNCKDPFFKVVCDNLKNLTDAQIVNLLDGIVEVSRRRLGCLVFVGNISENKEKYFLKENSGNQGEVTRLGISLNIVSNIPNHFSEDFRNAFALEAGMDGETIVSCNAFNQHLVGSILGRKFVHLPNNATALLNNHKPTVSRNYSNSWNTAKGIIHPQHFSHEYSDSISFRVISEMQQSELISIGTRHRKASMISMAFPSVLAITSSSSGNIKMWIKGVPIIDVKPDTKKMLDYYPTPKK